MKLSKAIEIQTKYVNQPYSKFHAEFTEATKLGIEALKYVSIIRQADPGHCPGPFPGETPE